MELSVSAANIIIELFTAAICVLGIVAMNMFGRYKKELRNTFAITYAFAFFYVFFDALAGLLRGSTGVTARVFIYLTNFLSFVSLYFMVGSAVILALRVVAKDDWQRIFPYFDYTIKIVNTCMLILLIFNIPFEFMYKIDEANLYVRTDGFLVISIYGAIMVGLIIATLVYYRKKMTKREWIVFTLLLSFIAVTLVLQLFFYGFSFFNLAVLASVIVTELSMFALLSEDFIATEKANNQKELDIMRLRDTAIISQVKPHFIYNPLNAIKMIDGSPPKTKKAITDFAKYLRVNLVSLETIDLIKFDDELDHVKTYIDIEKLRFGDEVNVEYDIKDNAFSVPVLSVQVLVENAVKHGIAPKRGGGTIKISSYLQDNAHHIVVEDDGLGFDVNAPLDTTRTHIGLESVKNRLKLRINGELKIESEIDKGTKAEIIIPINEG